MSDMLNKHVNTSMSSSLQTTHQTAHGQLLDLTTAPPGTTDLSKFTVNNYMRIVTFKTAYYSFYLPVACGMLIAGINRPAAFQTAKEILLIMGQYFQACFLLLHHLAALLHTRYPLGGKFGQLQGIQDAKLPSLLLGWGRTIRADGCVHCRAHLQVRNARAGVVSSTMAKMITKSAGALNLC